MTKLLSTAFAVALIVSAQSVMADDFTDHAWTDAEMRTKCLRSSAFTGVMIRPETASPKVIAKCESLVLGPQQWQGRR